eukprot:gene36486-44999_t
MHGGFGVLTSKSRSENLRLLSFVPAPPALSPSLPPLEVPKINALLSVVAQETEGSVKAEFYYASVMVVVNAVHLKAVLKLHEGSFSVPPTEVASDANSKAAVKMVLWGQVSGA